MTERGRGSRDGGRGRGGRVGPVETSEDRLQQLISTRLQSIMTSVLSQVNQKHDEVKTILEKLNDRISGLEEFVKSRDSQSETSSELPCSPTKKSRHESTSEGSIILKEFADSSSVFKTRLRERLRRFCLSKQGGLYFPPHKKEVI
jgi:hypothetical protein